MAEDSSSDDWFDPEEITTSTNNLLQQQSQTEGEIDVNVAATQPADVDHKPPAIAASTTTTATESNINTDPEPAYADANHHDMNNGNDPIPNGPAAIPNTDKQNSSNTSSFPAELQAAYKLMQANQNKPANATKPNDEQVVDDEVITTPSNPHKIDPHRMVVNKDTGLGYDIDNLPIDITETPMLSLRTLKKSVANLELSNNGKTNDDEHSHKKQKAKYSNFFVKNFFLKRHDNEKNTEQKGQKHEDSQSHNNDEQEEKKQNVNLHRIKMRGNTKDKAMTDLRLAQKIQHAHKGAIYCMEFSKKGDYLATGGQDSVLRVWTVCGSRADLKRWDVNNKECEKSEASKTTDTHYSQSETPQQQQSYLNAQQRVSHKANESDAEIEYNFDNILSIVAYREFTGHRADIIDISWSNGEFILSASIDQTVMLWHTSRTRCLCLFQHADIVTSVQFHPNEDYLFLSGSFDSRLRLWNILEHRVVDWVQVPTLVTSTTFSVNGKFAIAGLYDGQCFFYSTQGHRLKYVTAIECRNAAGKYRKGRKVTGLQYLPLVHTDNHHHTDKQRNNDGNHRHLGLKSHRKANLNNMEHGSPELLISTNDSRLRLYTLSNFDQKCKYKGHENTQSQIHARFSPDGQLIICGSEDNNIYIWKTEKSSNDESSSIFQSKKSKNRQEYYEYFKSNSKLPQVALFAPHRTIHYVHKYRTVINQRWREMYRHNEEKIKHIILTADTEGHIHIYTNHSDEADYVYPYHHSGHHYTSRHHRDRTSSRMQQGHDKKTNSKYK